MVAYITGEGLKTLDVARGTFEAWEIDPSVEAFERASERVGALADRIPCRWRSASRSQPSCGPRPTASRRPSVDGSTVGEVLDALYERYGELRARIAEDGGLRRFVNVYVDGEDIRFLDGLDTPVEDGDEVTILPAVAGG